jgi:hypothetical protein
MAGMTTTRIFTLGEIDVWIEEAGISHGLFGGREEQLALI